MSNRCDCRWEKQSLQRTTTPESTLSNEFQCLGKSNVRKGTTTTESHPFNSLDVVAHYERHEMSTFIECLLLDDSDAAIDNHMSHIFGDFLVIESSIDVKLHFQFYNWNCMDPGKVSNLSTWTSCTSIVAGGRESGVLLIGIKIKNNAWRQI